MKWKHTQEVPAIIRWYMLKMGYRGLITFWGTIYYLNQAAFFDTELRREEERHAQQYERDGILKYLIMYNYYRIRYGYAKNPYEIEAKGNNPILF